MLAWQPPPEASWDSPYLFICFNDECPYFMRGWEWMKSHFNMTASYRYRLDPGTGDAGPLPVWSHDALKDNILSDEAGPNA